ncbi:MAG: DUF4136 domain-containing protein [Acidobacteriota bacterium]
MKLFRISAAVVCVALLCVGLPAAHADAKTDYNHSVNFSQYHTYSWGKVQTDNPLVAQRIHKAVNILLKQKGWQLVPSGGQVTVFALANVHNQKEAETLYDGMGGWGMGWGWGGWGWGPGGGFGESTTNTYNQPVGHLTIDLFDTQSKKLLWRGISSANLSNDPGKNRKTLYKDIHDMFDHFPPKK